MNNFISVGIEKELQSFNKFLQNRFEVGSFDHGRFDIMSCELDHGSDGTILLTQRTRLDDIDENVLFTLPRGIPVSHGSFLPPRRIYIPIARFL